MPRIVVFMLVLLAGAGIAPVPSLFSSASEPNAGPADSEIHAVVSRAFPRLIRAAKAAAPKAVQKYTCPMHPHYIASEMGACPICGMDLVPLASGDDAAAAPGAADRGQRQSIIVAAETIQNMGVRTARVEQTRFGREIRAYGIVRENEKLQQVVSNRLDGWIEELKVRAVGDPVTKGMLLYRIYSPELFVSQRDFLATLRGNGRDSVRARSTRQRLLSYGVQPKALRLLKKRGRVMMNMPFYAERNGVISELNISPGSFVKRGAMIARIQDYSKVWLMVSIAEQDLGFLTKNTRAQVTFPTLRDRRVEAEIDYIYPTVDAASRTGQVRLVIDNADGLLRPGTYADVVFNVDNRQKLAVPAESLLRSETGRYVIMSLGEGRFEPRRVKTGYSSNGRTEIVEGLKSGDEIVVSGQFLLDSESALRESFRKLERLQTPLDLLAFDKAQVAMMDHLVDAALYLHETQVDGYDVDAKFLKPAFEIRSLMWPEFQHTRLAPVLEEAEKAIGMAQKARTVSDVQRALHALVTALRPFLFEGRADYYKGKGLNLFAEEGGKRRTGRLWLQQGTKPLNPYGTAKARLVPWPDKNKPPAKGLKMSEKSSDGEQAGRTMRGSHAQ